MKRRHLAAFALVLGLAVVSGCAGPTPPPQVVVAPAPAASLSPGAAAPIALLPPPEATPSHVPTVRHRVVAVVHPVIHRHWTHRPYAMRSNYPPPGTPQCGSDAHPCSVEHIVVPVD
jgi:hypothetical protein